MRRTAIKRVFGGIVLLAGAFASFLPSHAAAADADRRGFVVSVSFEYLPAPVVIASGTSLRYLNLGPSALSLTADELDPNANAPLFDSGWVGLASQADVAGVNNLAPNPAGYGFHCEIHWSMTGTLIVLPA